MVTLCAHTIKRPVYHMRMWLCDICGMYIKPVSVKDFLSPLNKDQIEFKNNLTRQLYKGH